MKKQKIPSKQDFKNFVEGHKNIIKEKIGNLEPHIQEQVLYRQWKCKDDCAKEGKCIHCGCSFPGRSYATSSCNPVRFPDLMDKKDWDKFKVS